MSRPFVFLDKRPIVIVLAGSNGAGKSTFYECFLADFGLRFVNADVLSQSLSVNAYEAAALASSLRSALVAQQESFIFETVLSDPVGEKVDPFAAYAALGYTADLIFIQIDSPEKSIQRVAMPASLLWEPLCGCRYLPVRTIGVVGTLKQVRDFFSNLFHSQTK